ncbi:hypothetical protein LG047_15530 [Methylocystis sp. WRRC1]|uniref:DUF7303 family protein n=1 Tax=Methylocystis sp. WRRC1 TaxID=1732014 RepID=UPI001D13825C|nr:hypothetical protein [Methylocystis sp. WRRC1]MCC3246711.1 hypothetical protein [Methylocystis sp. WRRC1]
MTIEIEDNVPVPVVSRRSGVEYPFGQLAVGQSFFVADVKRGTLASRAHAFGKHQTPKWKFKVAPAEKDGASGMRCWRVA